MQARPERPYRNLAEFCAKRGWDTRSAKPGETVYPSLTCGSRSWVYDPDDPPCPVEGNKNRNTLMCDGCQCTGRSNRKPCLQAYRKAIDEWKSKAARYDRLTALREAGLKRLTADQLAAIKELGL